MVLEHQAKMAEALDDLNALSAAAWKQLATIIQPDYYWVKLRNDTLFSAYISASWIATHAHAPYLEDPWKCARSANLSEAIEDRCAGEEPDDPFMFRVWHLYHANEPMPNLEKLFLSLRELDCTNRKEEDKHKTLSWQRVLHRKMGFNQLACRTYLASVCQRSGILGCLGYA